MRFPFRRSRLAALVLLFASPGLTGLAVGVAHPCPEAAPWLGNGNQSVDPSHHHLPQGNSDLPTGSHDCTCLGDCQTAPAARAIDANPVLARAETVLLTAARPRDSVLYPVSCPRDRLPPATAPPLV